MTKIDPENPWQYFLPPLGALSPAGPALPAQGREKKRKGSTVASDQGSLSLLLSISNDYTNQGESDTGEGYSHITVGRVVEPMRETTLAMSLADESGSDLSTCYWLIEQASGTAGVVNGAYTYSEDVVEPEGVSVAHTFAAPATYSVSVTCTDADSGFHTLSTSVECVYVRRELRDLSSADMTSFLDTFAVMMGTSTKEGRKTYGANYRSLDYYVRLHLKGAGSRNADQIHDGMGVLTQHATMTSDFELSMQTVAPSLSVPYWDYTIDSAAFKVEDKGDASVFFESEFWVSNFGSTSSRKHSIDSGRFADQQVSLASEDDEVKSPYGFLRAPWNLNPSSSVTRFHKMCGLNPRAAYAWPTCENHYALTFQQKTWYDWVWTVSYLPHGPVHAWIGGMGGTCDGADLSDWLESSYEQKVKLNMFGVLKNMWRSEMIEMPKYCSEGSECTVQCVKDSNKFVHKFTAQLKGFGGVPDDIMSNFTEAAIMDMADRLLCGKQLYPGDHLEAASPVEASFWPIHPTLDRLYQYKTLVDPFHGTAWDVTVMDDGDDDAHKFCELDSDSDCLGHHPGDLTVGTSVVRQSSGAYTLETVSNAEALAAVTPGSGYTMPYVYQNFKWAHCTSSTSGAVAFPSVGDAAAFR